MMDLKQTLDEIISVENESALALEKAKAESQRMLKEAFLSREASAKEERAKIKQTVSSVLEQGKKSREKILKDRIEKAEKDAEAFTAKASENVDDVSDYIVRKLKINYGNR